MLKTAALLAATVGSPLAFTPPCPPSRSIARSLPITQHSAIDRSVPHRVTAWHTMRKHRYHPLQLSKSNPEPMDANKNDNSSDKFVDTLTTSLNQRQIDVESINLATTIETQYGTVLTEAGVRPDAKCLGYEHWCDHNRATANIEQLSRRLDKVSSLTDVSDEDRKMHVLLAFFYQIAAPLKPQRVDQQSIEFMLHSFEFASPYPFKLATLLAATTLNNDNPPVITRDNQILNTFFTLINEIKVTDAGVKQSVDDTPLLPPLPHSQFRDAHLQLNAPVLVVTGGIASGKSTVSQRLAHNGGIYLSLDNIWRECRTPGSDISESMIYFLGDDFRDEQTGGIDLPKLRALIGTNQHAKKWLDRFSHPIINCLLSQKLQALTAQQKIPHLILEIPLLVETDFPHPIVRQQNTTIINVMTSDQNQITRGVKRSGHTMSEKDMQALIQLQALSEDRERIADINLNNSGSLDDLQKTCDSVLQQCLSGKKSIS